MCDVGDKGHVWRVRGTIRLCQIDLWGVVSTCVCVVCGVGDKRRGIVWFEVLFWKFLAKIFTTC